LRTGEPQHERQPPHSRCGGRFQKLRWSSHRPKKVNPQKVNAKEISDMPLQQYGVQATGQSLGFRPAEPEQAQSPPSWWTGDRVGDILGGDASNPAVIRQWWRDIAEPGDPFVVRLLAEDRIGGSNQFRTAARLEVKVKAENLDSAGARKMSAALSEAAELLDG
jgi:hypothetical protein